MGFKCGIVGLPNVGKSTLFNALTNSSKAQAANFPFCTIEPNIGMVPVPDKRLDELSKVSSSSKKIYTTISFVDIAGLVKGASKGEGRPAGARKVPIAQDQYEPMERLHRRPLTQRFDRRRHLGHRSTREAEIVHIDNAHALALLHQLAGVLVERSCGCTTIPSLRST